MIMFSLRFFFVILHFDRLIQWIRHPNQNSKHIKQHTRAFKFNRSLRPHTPNCEHQASREKERFFFLYERMICVSNDAYDSKLEFEKISSMNI